jgi:hypothetical protein
MSTPARMLNQRTPVKFRKGAMRQIAGAFVMMGAVILASRETAAQSPAPASSEHITPAGQWLATCLDRLDVERHWLRGHEHVAWKTGLPLTREHGVRLTPLQQDETHCSAFAAAAADALGVYLLHPPEHSHVLLANAQYDWLPSDAGRKAGWRAVETAIDAQCLANAGELVVAVFKNPDGTKAGHIAIVRPSDVSDARIEAQGPQITQAGFNNFRSAPLASGFDHHPGAWERGGRGAVKFYAHVVKGEDLAGE